MEEKNVAKISLSTLFLIIAIIVIIIMGVFIYKLNNDKVSANKEIANLNNQIKSLESTVSNLQGTIDNISNTINTSKNNADTTSSNKYDTITEELKGIDVLYITDATKVGSSYTLKGVIYTQYTLTDSELQKILNDGSFSINNETYTIKKSNSANEYDLFRKNDDYPLYKLKKSNSTDYYLEAQAQISNVWKMTNEYKEITVPSNTKCSVNFDYEEEYKTVEDVFKNFKSSNPIDTTNPDDSKTFTFKFENGKCIEVISTLTSV